MTLVNFPGTIPGVAPGYEDIDELKVYLEALRTVVNGGIDAANIGSFPGLTDAQFADAANIALTKLAPVPCCAVRRSTNQAVTGSGYVTFDTEMFDPGGFYNPAQPDKLTAPFAGYYRVTACLEAASHVYGMAYIEADNNGRQYDEQDLAGFSGARVFNTSFEGLLQQNAAVRLGFAHGSGGAINVVAQNPYSPYMSMRLISRA